MPKLRNNEVLIFISLCLFLVWLSVLSVHLSPGLSIFLSISLLVCLPAYRSVYFSFYLPVCLIVCLYVCMSVFHASVNEPVVFDDNTRPQVRPYN